MGTALVCLGSVALFFTNTVISRYPHGVFAVTRDVQMIFAPRFRSSSKSKLTPLSRASATATRYAGTPRSTPAFSRGHVQAPDDITPFSE